LVDGEPVVLAEEDADLAETLGRVHVREILFREVDLEAVRVLLRLAADEDDARLFDGGADARVGEADGGDHAVALLHALDRLRVEADVGEVAELDGREGDAGGPSEDRELALVDHEDGALPGDRPLPEPIREDDGGDEGDEREPADVL